MHWLEPSVSYITYAATKTGVAAFGHETADYGTVYMGLGSL